MTDPCREVLTEEIDRHWLSLGQQVPPSALCSCGEWQWDFDHYTPIAVGDEFLPFSEHIADAILAHLPKSQAERDGLALARLPDWFTLIGEPVGFTVDSYLRSTDLRGYGPTIEAAVNAALGDET